MQRPPDRGDQLFGRESWAAIGLVGLLVGIAALGAFLAGRALDREASQTIAFATIALSELLVVFAVRSPLEAAWRSPRNGYLLAAVAASVLLLALTIYLPGLQDPFGTVALEIRELAVVLGLLAGAVRRRGAREGALRRFAPAWAASALRTTRQAPASDALRRHALMPAAT